MSGNIFSREREGSLYPTRNATPNDPARHAFTGTGVTGACMSRDGALIPSVSACFRFRMTVIRVP